MTGGLLQGLRGDLVGLAEGVADRHLGCNLDPGPHLLGLGLEFAEQRLLERGVEGCDPVFQGCEMPGGLFQGLRGDTLGFRGLLPARFEEGCAEVPESPLHTGDMAGDLAERILHRLLGGEPDPGPHLLGLGHEFPEQRLLERGVEGCDPVLQGCEMPGGLFQGLRGDTLGFRGFLPTALLKTPAELPEDSLDASDVSGDLAERILHRLLGGEPDHGPHLLGLGHEFPEHLLLVGGGLCLKPLRVAHHLGADLAERLEEFALRFADASLDLRGTLGGEAGHLAEGRHEFLTERAEGHGKRPRIGGIGNGMLPPVDKTGKKHLVAERIDLAEIVVLLLGHPVQREVQRHREHQAEEGRVERGAETAGDVVDQLHHLRDVGDIGEIHAADGMGETDDRADEAKERNRPKEGPQEGEASRDARGIDVGLAGHHLAHVGAVLAHLEIFQGLADAIDHHAVPELRGKGVEVVDEGAHVVERDAFAEGFGEDIDHQGELLALEHAGFQVNDRHRPEKEERVEHADREVPVEERGDEVHRRELGVRLALGGDEGQQQEIPDKHQSGADPKAQQEPGIRGIGLFPDLPDVLVGVFLAFGVGDFGGGFQFLRNGERLAAGGTGKRFPHLIRLDEKGLLAVGALEFHKEPPNDPYAGS